jgi:hypothetical protein
MLVVNVIAGVELAVATVPAKPLADTTDKSDTVPDPAPVPFAAHVITPEASDISTNPVVPGYAVGQVYPWVPATAGEFNVIVPEVEPLITSCDVTNRDPFSVYAMLC